MQMAEVILNLYNLYYIFCCHKVILLNEETLIITKNASDWLIVNYTCTAMLM